jgi:hypothetical protein
VKSVTINSKDKPWITPYVKEGFRLRDKAHKTLKTSNTLENCANYRYARHAANERKKEAKRIYNERIAKKLIDPKTNVKEYWRLTKQIFGDKVDTNIPTIIDQNKTYTTPKEKANVFNNFFLQKSKLPDLKPQLPEFEYKTNARLESVSATVEATESIINSSDPSKANGPDNISNRLLKKVCSSISRPLTKIFNMSFSSGKFPDIWKHANVNPLHKDDDRQFKKNYRPISLLSNISKILEKHAFVAIYNYCMTHGLLTWRNSGYKRMDSTVNQLIFITHKIYESLEKGRDFIFLSCDASAAFDRVWHDGLIFKIKQLGIKGKLLAWLTDYLTGRKQRVTINGQYSEWVKIEAGVPQTK